ncbi:MAG: putative bifunctional diguanylate cyclase/phosphodiesterase [Candidatus Limnocylindrales bacterium]
MSAPREHLRTMRGGLGWRWAWVAYALLGLVGLGWYCTAASAAQQTLTFGLYGAGAVAACLSGIAHHRPARRGAWWLLAVGVALEAGGNWLEGALAMGTGSQPFPSVADAAYLAGYLALALGLVALVWRRDVPTEVSAWIDALIVAVAAGMVAWNLLLDRYLADPALSVPALVVSLAYPILDVVLLGVLAHLLLAAGRPNASLALLAVGVAANLAADSAYFFLALDRTYRVGELVDAGWLAGYVAWGAAVLHPAMAHAGEPLAGSERPPGGLSARRLMLLAGGALVAPCTAAAAALRGDPLDLVAILLGSSGLYLLVLTRLVLGLRAQRGLAAERGRLAATLAREASHDPLTGLLNRSAFLARMEAELARARAGGPPVAVLYFDLDRLKAVNDALGHPAGDAVLRALAERLRLGLRGADVIGRLGGDEFAVLAEGQRLAGARALADRLQALLAEPVVLQDQPWSMSASVGLALARHGERAEELLRRADLAMYMAKGEGGAALAVYSPSLDEAVRERRALEADLRLAVPQGELLLYYQPIVELPGGAITGLEALLRWQHPRRGLLGPDAFLPLAEGAGVRDAIETWVLRTAIRQAIAWHRAGILRRPLLLDINVSARALAEPGFRRELAADLAGSGLGPGRIALELTETDLVRDAERVGQTMAALRRAGVRIVIDDFGTAYAAMSYLADFPVDGLKIDRSFVAALGDDPGPRGTLVAAMLALARSFEISAVAEGVETPAQAAALVRLGCRYAQGFLYARPLPAAAMRRLLAEGRIALPTTTPPHPSAAPPRSEPIRPVPARTAQAGAR